MKSVVDWSKIGVHDFCLNYFSWLKKIGFLTTTSSDFDYFLVDSICGKIAILFYGDYRNDENKFAFGGEGRFGIYDKSSKVTIGRVKTKKQKYISESLREKIIDYLDGFPIIVMVVGCDDMHMCFYFKSEKGTYEVLNMVDCIDELLSIATPLEDIKNKLNGNLKVEDVICILDYRN